MTTVRVLVSDALRESGILALGADPDADEFAEGLRRLSVIIKSLPGNEMGEQLRSSTFGLSGSNSHTGENLSSLVRQTYVPSNYRLILNLSSSYTLYLDPDPEDGAQFAVIDMLGNLATYPITINANGRQIESATTATLNTNSLNRSWFYRADLGTWQRISDIDENSDSPYPAEFDDLLVTLLAMRLNPRYGVEMSNSTAQALNMSRSKFRARYRQSAQAVSEMGLQVITPWPDISTDFLTGR